MLSHLSLLVPAGDTSREHLHSLLRARHLPFPADDSNHLSIDLGGLHLRWVQHAEFQTYTLWRTLSEAPDSFDASAVRDMPTDWLAPKRMLVSVIWL